MATERGIAATLAYLHELYPTRDITEATGAAWFTNFSDTDDDVLLSAAKSCGRNPERKFFPTAGELRSHIPVPLVPPAISPTEVLRQIEGMGAYHNGWQWPRVEAVRLKLGDSVASAYGEVGPHRLNSDNATTREIAQRDFAETLHAERKQEVERHRLNWPDAPKQIGGGT